MYRLSNKDIELLPITSYCRRITLIEKKADVALAVAQMKNESVLGFDTETRPSFTRGVSYSTALLQLSSPDVAWLFRLNKIGLPPDVISILADPNIIKAGAAIRDDVRGLQRYKRFTPAGFVDLQTIAKEHGFEDFSLKKLAAHVMGVRISKRQRLTNWEAQQLTVPQQVYAATDSWVSLMIYNGMMAGEYEHPRVREIIALRQSQTQQ